MPYRILASKRDQEIFFDLVTKGTHPNEVLKAALQAYNRQLCLTWRSSCPLLLIRNIGNQSSVAATPYWIVTFKNMRDRISKKMAACFILSDDEDAIKDYYTLSNTGIPREAIPENIRVKLPGAYDLLLVTLLGRLAVDEKYKGAGLGKLLLVDALKRSCEVSRFIGSMAAVVDLIDKDAGKFYSKYGFVFLPDSKKMFPPMKTIEQLFM